jgi:ubiquinone/menaquinone biosynthesis C-methylase UbiE
MNDKSGFQACELASRCYESRLEHYMPRFVDSPTAAWVSFSDVVLDLACGPGIAARAASVAISTTRPVVGNDLNPSEKGSEHE